MVDNGHPADADGLSSQAMEPQASPPKASIPDAENPIVGWGTTVDGKHVPIRKDYANALWGSAMAAKAKREADMPDEQSAIRALNDAYTRLQDLGWANPIYCPKDGSTFDVIEAGSTGIFPAHYEGTWPDGTWWIHEDGVCPSRPVMYRVTEAEKKQRQKMREAFRKDAKAMETGTAKTEGLGAKHDSAVAKPFAQKDEPNG